MSLLSIVRKAVDEVTQGIIVVEYEHHEIHEAKTFQASYKTAEGADVADNVAVTMLIRLGSRKTHITFSGAAGGDAELELYEGPTVSDVGASLTRNNMNRADALMTPSTQVYIGPTASPNGTRIHHSLLPGGSGPRAGGGVARTNTEWIFAPNTDYLAIITNRSGNAQPVSIVAQWYEK